MKIGVIGTGYVGLVTGTCFSEIGNDVVCVDNNADKVKQMQQGVVPIYEPGLEDIFSRNIKEGRLAFTTDIQGVLNAEVIFLALPTPPGEDGSADLSYILGVAETLGKVLDQYTVIINKSTVPIGTAEKVRAAVAKNSTVDFDVVSNPEFLREGQAVADFMNPDRVVIGASSEKATKIMTQLYAPLVRTDPSRLIVTDPSSAEMIKYAANAFLATKISFMNGLTAFCEATGADIDMVRMGMGADSRIGPAFLHPGPGYGGSCFPKDTLALQMMAKEYGLDLKIVDATIQTNDIQKTILPNKIKNYYKGELSNKKFALLGLAFKDNTDDIRESPALKLVDELTGEGATIVAFDPQAMENVRHEYSGNERLQFAKDEYEAMDGADAMIVITNWKEFSSPDWVRVKKLLKEPVIFDGRNMYNVAEMKSRGFYYDSLGRKLVKANG